jgi:hypothetical protein
VRGSFETLGGEETIRTVMPDIAEGTYLFGAHDTGGSVSID